METRENYIFKNFAKAIGCLALLPVIDLICYFIQNPIGGLLCLVVSIRLIFEIAACVKHILVDDEPKSNTEGAVLKKE